MEWHEQEISLKETTLPVKLQRDVEGVVGSIYSMNASYAIGYAFTQKNGVVNNGEFVSFRGSLKMYDYFLNYRDKKYYKITVKETE